MEESSQNRIWSSLHGKHLVCSKVSPLILVGNPTNLRGASLSGVGSPAKINESRIVTSNHARCWPCKSVACATCYSMETKLSKIKSIISVMAK